MVHVVSPLHACAYALVLIFSSICVREVHSQGIITDTAASTVLGTAPQCVYADEADLAKTHLDLDLIDPTFTAPVVNLAAFSDAEVSALCAAESVVSVDMIGKLLDFHSVVEMCNFKGAWAKYDYTVHIYNMASINQATLVLISEDEALYEIPHLTYNSVPRGTDFDLIVCNTIKSSENAEESIYLRNLLFADAASDTYIDPADLTLTITVEVNPWIELFNSWWYVMIFRAIMPTMFLGVAMLCVVIFVAHMRRWYTIRQKQHLPMDAKDLVIRVGLPLEFIASIALSMRMYFYGWFSVENDIVGMYTWGLFPAVFVGIGVGQTALTAVYWHDLYLTIGKPKTANPVSTRVIVGVVVTVILALTYDIVIYFSVLYGWIGIIDYIMNILRFVCEVAILIYFFRNFYTVRKRVVKMSKGTEAKARLKYISALLVISGIVIILSTLIFMSAALMKINYTPAAFVPLWVMTMIQRGIFSTVLQALAMAPKMYIRKYLCVCSKVSPTTTLPSNTSSGDTATLPTASLQKDSEIGRSNTATSLVAPNSTLPPTNVTVDPLREGEEKVVKQAINDQSRACSADSLDLKPSKDK
jgi:hypothetical protein